MSRSKPHPDTRPMRPFEIAQTPEDAKTMDYWLAKGILG